MLQIVGASDQVSADGIAFGVAEDGQEMIVLLDRKSAKTALPDVAAAVIVLLVVASSGLSRRLGGKASEKARCPFFPLGSNRARDP
jgi:hypothetical protein